MSSSRSRKKLLLNTVSVSLGCGSCRRPKLSHIFHLKPKSKNPTYQKHKLYNYNHSSSSSDTATTTNTGTTFSPYYMDSSQSQLSEAETSVKASGTVGGVAVEKDSDDPYLDFRHSMLQMIMENEIYSKDDLRELLNCFLQLNSPYHHGAIVRAFTEIWNGFFYVRSNSPRLRLTRKSREF